MIGLGVQDLSLIARDIPHAKNMILQVEAKQCEELVNAIAAIKTSGLATGETFRDKAITLCKKIFPPKTVALLNRH